MSQFSATIALVFLAAAICQVGNAVRLLSRSSIPAGMKRSAAFRSALPVILRDLAGIGGVCLISAGCGEIYPPAGLIAAGILLVSGALMTARRG